MKVLLAAGGTAGHIEPALTLADTLMRDDPQTEVVVVGREDGLEIRPVPARGYRLRTVPAVPLPRKPSKDLALVPVRVSGSVRRMQAILRDERPDVVVGFGGYVALPAYLAARRAGIPLVIHEANSRAGVANRVGARLTPWVAENVGSSLPRATRVGMPLRPEIVGLAETHDREGAKREARAHFGLDVDRPTLLVFGGSLGAQHINEVVTGCADDFADAGIQVLHAVGERAAGVGAIAERAPGQAPYVVVPYVDRMDLAYAAADLAVSRAGAMTCAELSAIGLPALYVPLPVGNGEQRLNAQPVVNSGGGLIVDDADFTAATVRDTVMPLVRNEGLLQRMSAAASAHGVRDGDRRLADLVRAAVAAGGRS